MHQLLKDETLPDTFMYIIFLRHEKELIYVQACLLGFKLQISLKSESVIELNL